MTSVEIPLSIAAALPNLTVLDITNDVQREVAAGGGSGIAFVSPNGDPSLIRVQERETGFFSDLEGLLERLVPLEAGERERLVSLLLGPADGADPLHRGPASSGPVPAHLPRSLRGSLHRRMDGHGRRRRPRWRLTPQGSDPRFDLRALRRTLWRGMERARRHQRALARLALIFLALIAELSVAAFRTGSTSAATSGRRATPARDYYPILLAVVKFGVALMLARLAWRFVKASRVLAAHGSLGAGCRRRVRIELSPKLWLGSFLATSLIYLVQMDAEGISTGRWPLLAPWLHTSALPGVRRALGRRRGRLPRRRAVALRVRDVRTRSRRARIARAAPRCRRRARRSPSSSLRAHCSGSRSRAGLRRCTPEACGPDVRRPVS